MIFTIYQHSDGSVADELEVSGLPDGIRFCMVKGGEEAEASIILPYEKVTLLCGVLSSLCNYKKEI